LTSDQKNKENPGKGSFPPFIFQRSSWSFIIVDEVNIISWYNYLSSLLLQLTFLSPYFFGPSAQYLQLKVDLVLSLP